MPQSPPYSKTSRVAELNPSTSCWELVVRGQSRHLFFMDEIFFADVRLCEKFSSYPEDHSGAEVRALFSTNKNEALPG